MSETKFVMKQDPITKDVEIELWRLIDDKNWMMFDRLAPITPKELKQLGCKIVEVFAKSERK